MRRPPNDVSPLGSYIDANRYRALRTTEAGLVPKNKVAPTRSGDMTARWLQFREPRPSEACFVDIENRYSRCFAGRHRNQQSTAAAPQRRYPLGIGCGVLKPVLGRRPLVAIAREGRERAAVEARDHSSSNSRSVLASARRPTSANVASRSIPSTQSAPRDRAARKAVPLPQVGSSSRVAGVTSISKK